MLGRFDETNETPPQMNAKVTPPQSVAALLPLFQVVPDLDRVLLFGSRARGDHQERSDIDLAVDAPNMDILTWDKLCQNITDNSQTLLSVDLIWLQQTPARLRNRIHREGVIVFEREDESIGGESKTCTLET